ncbi:hypothetical protein BV25DRAFT_740421 [Artomyces pyxidatus]|uniref:Uncharacterized protein n=1 Tax=Artomyces pyxidatus TaxID=48021 RepID=A0ACB8T120_9AGAM|nr:hypothetical protein BV25DRAFT_740421 [Artomyces pyxidatus]
MSAANNYSDPSVLPTTITVLAPYFIGNAVNLLLTGTLIVQVYMFYVNFPGERLRVQLLVYGVFLLDIAQTALGSYMAWWWMITNWNKPSSFVDTLTWRVATLPIMCGLVSGIVQSFYAWQIWALTTNVVMHSIAALIVVVALGQSLTAVTLSSLLLSDLSPDTFFRISPGFAFWLAGSFVADILICGSMLWILFRAKTTLWGESETWINKLILNTIRTGTITVVCATFDLILFVVLKHSESYLAPAYILGKLYTNSLVATLNGRRTMFRANVEQSESVKMSSTVSRRRGLRFNRSGPASMEGSTQFTTWASAPDVEATISGSKRPVQVVGFTAVANDNAAEVKSDMNL